MLLLIACLLIACLLIFDAIGQWKVIHYIANLCSPGIIELHQSPVGAISGSMGFAIKDDERVCSLKSKNVPCIQTLTAFPKVLCIPHITGWRLHRDP